jgi:multiple sugar transport system substrate-binding protein
VAALTFLQKLIKAGGTEPGVTASTRTDLETEFDSGKVAMMIDGPWLPKGAIKAKVPVGLANMPHQPGVPMRNTAIEDSWVIFTGSADQEKAAAKFSEYMFSTPVRTLFDKTEGFLPVEKAVGSEPYFTHDPVMSVYLKAFAGPTVAEPIVPQFSAISLAVTNAVEAVYAGSSSPSSALAAANAKVNAALAG